MDDDPLLSGDSSVTIDGSCAICGSSHDGDLHVPQDEDVLNQCIHDLLAIAEDRLAKNHNGPFGLYVDNLREALGRAEVADGQYKLVYNPSCRKICVRNHRYTPTGKNHISYIFIRISFTFCQNLYIFSSLASLA